MLCEYPGWVEMCLKHGVDRDKLKYVVRRTWLCKGLILEFECINENE